MSDSDAGHLSDSDAALDSDVIDVSIDAFDASVRLTSCRGELEAMAGDPCFCQGPFVLDGDVAYRASYDLEVYDVSGSTVERTDTIAQTRPGSEGALALAYDHLFVGGWGLEVFDVTTRTRPRSTSVFEFDGTVTDLVVVGETLWVAIDEAELGFLRSYDISTPSEPREVGSVSLGGNPGSLMAFGSDRLVVIEARRFGEDGPDTAAIIDVSTRTPRVESRIDLAGGSVLRRRATVVGSMLYVAGRDPLLQILDLDSRRLISSLEAPEGGTSGGLGITVSDGLAFLSGWQIQVADVSALENPRWIGELTAPNDVHYVERRGDTLFIGTGGYLGKIPLDCR